MTATNADLLKLLAEHDDVASVKAFGARHPRFIDYLRDKVGSNWVLAKRTPRIVARYGADVVCLSPGVYRKCVADFERQTGLSADGAEGEPCRRIAMKGLELLTALRALCDAVASGNSTVAHDPDLARALAGARDVIARTTTGA